ncbi:MAG: mechanosensitive ion channel family protein, partial [Pyrinomonadaceae bacterium]
IVIPNNEIYTNALLVKTAHKQRRSEYDVGVGYGDGIEEACEVIRNAVAGTTDVSRDPPVEALPWDLSASWVTIRARWWTDSRQADVVRVRAAAIKAIKIALDEAGIDMPYDTQVQLFHDQTESTEGDRSKQREGWPAPKEGSTKPRWQARVERKDARKTS